MSRVKLDFERRYPTANRSKFVFDGDLRRAWVKYRNKFGETFEITSNVFRAYYSDSLYWSPQIWDTNGTVQQFTINKNPLTYDVTKFDIFVNATDSFKSNFEALKTSWKGTAKDIMKVAVDKNDPYFASLLAACIISHMSGISRKHLTEGPKIVASIAR